MLSSVLLSVLYAIVCANVLLFLSCLLYTINLTERGTADEKYVAWLNLAHSHADYMMLINVHEQNKKKHSGIM